MCDLLEKYSLKIQGFENSRHHLLSPTSPPTPQVTSVVAKITIVPWEMKLIAMVTNEGCIILGHIFKSLNFNMGRRLVLFYSVA